MAISNEEALKNLYQQRDQLIEQIKAGETTVLKITGAIEVLEQLTKPEEPEEPEVFEKFADIADEVWQQKLAEYSESLLERARKSEEGK